MLKETETEETIVYVTVSTGYVYVKGSGPPETILLMGAHLN